MKNRYIIDLYMKILKKQCNMDELNCEIMNTKIMSKGYRLDVIDDYGKKVFEFVSEMGNYMSGVEKNNKLYNYDQTNENTIEIVQAFGFTKFDDNEIRIISDSLDNCEDWSLNEDEDLKTLFIEHLKSELDITGYESSLIFDQYMQIPVTKRVLLDTVKFLKKEMYSF